MNDDVSQNLINEVVQHLQTPDQKGSNTKQPKILFQGLVTQVNSSSCTVTIDGQNCSNIRYLAGASFTIGNAVWGIQDRSIKIVLGKLSS